jgi:hypothetical protein
MKNLKYYIPFVKSNFKIKYFFFFLGLIFLLACKNKDRQSNKIDLCNSYLLKLYTIKPAVKDTISTILFSESIGIEFFNTYKLVEKYDFKGQYDSLPDWITKFGRQTIYNAIDTYNMYLCSLKPKLNSSKIKIIEGNFDDDFVSFKIENCYYTINVKKYRQKDGIILYKSGKYPIFWDDQFCCPQGIIEFYFK